MCEKTVDLQFWFLDQLIQMKSWQILLVVDVLFLS